MANCFKLIAYLYVILLLPVAWAQSSTCNQENSGTDQGAVINAAIAACPNGCTINIPPGNYTISTPIKVCNPNVHIVGGGQGVTKFNQVFNGDLITVSSDNFGLDGLTLNGNSAATGYNLVHIIGASHAKIHDSVFTDPRPLHSESLNGIRIEGYSSHASNFNIISNNSFTGIPWISVTIANNSNSNIVSSNQFNGCLTAFDFNGNEHDSSSNSFTNNIVSGGSGMNFLESVTSTIITSNHFINDGTQSGYSIYMHLASGSSQSSTIISNNIFSRGPGGGIIVYDNSRDALISNNIFDTNGTDGIYITNSAGAVTNLNLQGNLFKNNGIQNPYAHFGAIRIYTASGISVGNIAITNNIAYDDQPTPTQSYGLLVYGLGNAFNLSILGNDFARSSVAPISFQTTISNSSIGPNRESANGGWTFRTATGVVQP